MRSEQIFKLSKRSKIIVCIVLTMLFVVLCGKTVFANNCEDRDYSGYTGSYGFATHTRDKTDATSAYIYHYGPVGVNVQVRSQGINYTANGSSYYVAPGTSRYLPNYVYESGKRDCYLYITSVPSATVSGKWSPDSV
ncbi:DUF2712 domain-containing protein [Bilifractor sp. HCP3S3_D3]|uniref:DUF2712 domain-containing protein n=2 Tax=Lachnospirales TaxID=3085636 RepID=UPI003F8CBBDA